MSPSAAPARQLSATPSFAGITVCASLGCGAILSRYNTDPDGLCGACRRRVSQEPDPQPSGVDLDRLVAGLLLTHDAMHPGEQVNLASEIAALGIETDCWQIHDAMRHVSSRHGIIARGVRGRPGYALIEWQRRYQPVVGFGGIVMDRDPDSGRYAGPVAQLLPQSEGQREVPASQSPLPGFEGTDNEG